MTLSGLQISGETLGRPSQIRPSEELVELINYVRARCLLSGKKVVSTVEITKAIAKRVRKEELWNEDFSE